MLGNRACLGLLASASIIGCAEVAQQPTPKMDSGADAIIAEAMRETAKANRIAADLEKRFAGLSSSGLGQIEIRLADDGGTNSAPLAIRWNGPLEPLARSLADSAGFELRVLGTPPAQPVLVSVHAKSIDLQEAVGRVDAAAFGLAEFRMNAAAGAMEIEYPYQ